MTKLAPYGRNLQGLEEPPFYLFIMMGRYAWSRAKNFHSHFPATLCLPPDESPFDYDWPVDSHDVVLIDTSLTRKLYVQEMVLCMYTYKAKSVRYISINVPMTEFKKESQK